VCVLIRIGGLDTYYGLEGQGDPVVLLHGWGTSSQSLAGVAASLRGTFRVLSLDLPGFGWSQAPPEAWGMREYVTHLLGLLDETGIPRAALVGHSFGGRIAVSLAARQPERVSRLALVASPGIRSKRSARYRLTVATTKLLSRVLALPCWGAYGERLLSRWRDRVGSRDYRAAGRMRPTLVRVVNEDLAPLLPMVQAPTLLLWGDRDPEVGRQAVEIMAARIPGARLTVFPGAGHFPFQDDPDEFCRRLTGFLQGKDREWN
jgi:pimeloyl-ACP methyl ester carboxylesterase